MRQSHTHSTPRVFLRKVPFPLYEKTGANEQNTPFLRQLNIVTFAGLFTPTLLSQNVYNHPFSTLCQTKQYHFHSYTYCSLIQSPFHSNSCLNSTLFLETLWSAQTQKKTPKTWKFRWAWWVILGKCPLGSGLFNWLTNGHWLTQTRLWINKYKSRDTVGKRK